MCSVGQSQYARNFQRIYLPFVGVTSMWSEYVRKVVRQLINFKPMTMRYFPDHRTERGSKFGIFE